MSCRSVPKSPVKCTDVPLTVQSRHNISKHLKEEKATKRFFRQSCRVTKLYIPKYECLLIVGVIALSRELKTLVTCTRVVPRYLVSVVEVA